MRISMLLVAASMSLMALSAQAQISSTKGAARPAASKAEQSRGTTNLVTNRPSLPATNPVPQLGTTPVTFWLHVLHNNDGESRVLPLTGLRPVSVARPALRRSSMCLRPRPPRRVAMAWRRDQ